MRQDDPQGPDARLRTDGDDAQRSEAEAWADRAETLVSVLTVVLVVVLVVLALPLALAGTL